LIDRILRDIEHGAVQQPVFRKAESVDLDLGLLPGPDKADIAVPTIASISGRLSSGTTSSSACAGVTTPPIVWTASCCTVPSTGARRICNRDFCEALTTSWARPAALASAVASSPSRVRRYSAAAWARVSMIAASAA
jgi:hypothetical protein